ncbi:hypothetical protein EJB05_49388, partial [Eragrostis curvula]
MNGCVQDVVDTMEEARNVKQAQEQAVSGDGVQMPRPQLEEALKCPRCDSNNTKFRYYNNYNMSQPRYLCKTCRRFWTQGGTLRNVPVGGACCKNKRSSSLSSASPSSSNTTSRAINNNMPTLPGLTSISNVLPAFMSTGFEFSLPFAPPLSLSDSMVPAPAIAPGGSSMTSQSFLDLLRGGVLDHESNGGSGMEMVLPPSIGFGVVHDGIIGDRHSVASIDGGSATETTQLGGCNLWAGMSQRAGQWAGAHHGHNKDDGSAAGSDVLHQVGGDQQRKGVRSNKGNKNGLSTSRDNHWSNGGSMLGIRGEGLI